MAVAVAVPLTVLLVVNFLADVRHHFESEANRSQLEARHAAAAVTNILEQTRIAMAGLATRRAELLDPATCTAAALALVEVNPLYANLVVRNRLDQPICAARTGADAGAPARAVDPASFERALRENRFVVGAPLLGPITQRWVAVARHPLRNAEGQPIGVINLPLDLVSLGNAIGRMEEAPTGGSLLLLGQRDGMVLARVPDGERWVGKKIRDLDVVAAALDGGHAHVTGVGADGVERVYGYATVPLTGWIVAAGIPSDAIHAPLRRAAAQSLAVLLAVVAIVVALGTLVSRAISRPIRTLAQAAHAVEQGRTDERAPTRGPTELVAVAQQFNRMLDAQEVSIEALRTSEQAARAEHEKFESVFRAAPLPMTLSQAHSGIVIDANDAFCTVFGFTREELLGRSTLDLDTWVDPAQRQALLQALAERGHLHDFPTQRRLRSGAVRDVLMNVDRIKLDGEPCALATLNDVTVRNLAEKTLLESTELRAAAEHALQADKLKTAFLATMSHELRTPLNSIIGFTGVLLQGLAGPLNAEQTKQLGMVQGNARHLLALVNDVLDVAKIEAGALKVRSARFDLRASIHHVASSLAPLAESKGLTLRVDVAPEVGELVADQRRVEQVLINLLENAIKFTHSGSVTVSVNVDGDSMRIQVSDSGIGIHADDAELVFEPFQQVDDELTRSRDGTGLGLAISARLARLMGGAITLESKPGEGSTFCLRLPCEDAPEVVAAPAGTQRA